MRSRSGECTIYNNNDLCSKKVFSIKCVSSLHAAGNKTTHGIYLSNRVRMSTWGTPVYLRAESPSRSAHPVGFSSVSHIFNFSLTLDSDTDVLACALTEKEKMDEHIYSSVSVILVQGHASTFSSAYVDTRLNAHHAIPYLLDKLLRVAVLSADSCCCYRCIC